MYVVCVTVYVEEGHAAELETALLENARATRREKGNHRFDVLRAADDGNRFFIYEVYADEQAFRDHQQTPHYFKWRDTVNPWMAQPRQAAKYMGIFPESEEAWTAK